MRVLVVYDIDKGQGGAKRLAKIAKICETYGNRVQDSVFEIDADIAKIKRLEHELEQSIDKGIDSVRIYKISQKNGDIKILGRAGKIESLTDSSFIL